MTRPPTTTVRRYPDKIVVKFGLETSVIDQRLIQDSGDDQQALTLGDPIEPANLATVFSSTSSRTGA